MSGIPISCCKGIGEKRAETFRKAGIATLEDLLRFYPKEYVDCRQPVQVASLSRGQVALITVKAEDAPKIARFGGKSLVTLRCSDSSGKILLKWFNQPYRLKQYSQGRVYSFIGRADTEHGRCMISPTLYTGPAGILSIYPAIPGIGQTLLREAVQKALETETEEEILPEDIRNKEAMPGIREALRSIHSPESFEALEAAKKRMAFETALLYLIAVEMRRMEKNRTDGYAFSMEGTREKFCAGLRFVPTGAQLRAMEEIGADMEKPAPMNRLLQGDVGSGKTAVAMFAMMAAGENGCQSALMAPTELLARQHAESLNAFFGEDVCLLLGGMKKTERENALKRIASGDAKYVVGTHALFSADVKFCKLGLVITDEQHRFGVSQRAKAMQKGRCPDVLVMSATPIPRTMALMLLSDLDYSVLDEMPAGRQKISTSYISNARRGEMYRYIGEQAALGIQSYVVCPFIEDSEELSGMSAEAVYKELKTFLPNVSIGLLHGRMKKADQERTMNAFRSGEYDVLVTTTVIEVGVHVENACIMVIESADRFGLAQMHQLRGRVGRSSKKSYCFLLSDQPSETAKERISIMCSSCDGFFIAEKDFSLRGAGELIGTRQHGQSMWQWIMDLGDEDLLRKVRETAEKVIDLPDYGNNRLMEKAEEMYISREDPVVLN